MGCTSSHKVTLEHNDNANCGKVYIVNRKTQAFHIIKGCYGAKEAIAYNDAIDNHLRPCQHCLMNVSLNQVKRDNDRLLLYGKYLDYGGIRWLLYGPRKKHDEKDEGQEIIPRIHNSVNATIDLNSDNFTFIRGQVLQDNYKWHSIGACYLQTNPNNSLGIISVKF